MENWANICFRKIHKRRNANGQYYKNRWSTLVVINAGKCKVKEDSTFILIHWKKLKV